MAHAIFTNCAHIAYTFFQIFPEFCGFREHSHELFLDDRRKILEIDIRKISGFIFVECDFDIEMHCIFLL
jgi:hypothetical protein